MADYLLYDVTVSVITPLHIGSGRELMHEYDYAVHDRRTWRIDENALLDAQDVADPRLADRLATTPPAQLLRPADFQQDSPLFRYVLQGMPRSTQAGAQLREQLKDSFDRTYLPGSSLKGALRSALARHAWRARRMKPDLRMLVRSPKWAAQRIERDLFGETPNQDWLRALQVTDSAPLDATQLLVANAHVHHRGGRLAAPIELEAVRPDTVFQTRFKLDLALFSEWAARARLDLQGREMLEALPAVVQADSVRRAGKEHDWFKEIGNARRVATLYAQLGGAPLGATGFLLQLGWGTGWADKTLGDELQVDQPFMERIISDYRLSRGQRHSGDPFPRSRRVVVTRQHSRDGRPVEEPYAPLGWCLVEMKERAT